MQSSFIPISKFAKNPYKIVLGYPKAKKSQIDSRIKELKKLGITSVSFQGKLKLGRLNVLGKGYVGIVVLGKKRRKKVAIKIRRIDSQRKGMQSEARLLKIANKIGVGPLLIDSSKNFIVMEYLEGEKIGTWIRELKGKGSAKKLRTTIRVVLEDCYNLDKIGLDHGELSSIAKHVIVGKVKTTIIDLESASTERRVSNVTSAAQGIFIGSGIAKVARRVYKFPTKSATIKSLRHYKINQGREAFDKVLEILRL